MGDSQYSFSLTTFRFALSPSLSSAFSPSLSSSTSARHLRARPAPSQGGRSCASSMSEFSQKPLLGSPPCPTDGVSVLASCVFPVQIRRWSLRPLQISGQRWKAVSPSWLPVLAPLFSNVAMLQCCLHRVFLLRLPFLLFDRSPTKAGLTRHGDPRSPVMVLPPGPRHYRILLCTYISVACCSSPCSIANVLGLLICICTKGAMEI